MTLQSGETLDFAVGQGSNEYYCDSTALDVRITPLGVPEEPLAVTFRATDPSPADQAAEFTYYIDWDGDGAADQTVTGPNNIVVSHVFPDTGEFAVSVRALDKEQSPSEVATAVIPVSNVLVCGTDLIVIGTAGDDQIRLFTNDGDADGTVRVEVEADGVLQESAQESYSVPGVVYVFGLGGDDRLTVDGSQNTPNTFTKTSGTVTLGVSEAIEYSGIEHLTLNGGDLENFFNDPDTAATDLLDTTIVAGPQGSVNTIVIADITSGVIVQDRGGTNDIIIDMGNLAAPVTIQGTTGNNQVTINAAPDSNDVTLADGGLTCAAETVSLDLGSSNSSLILNLADGVNSVAVESTACNVTINGQGGTNSYVIDMSNLMGLVTINGSDGTSEVTIVAPSGENELTLTGSQDGTQLTGAGVTLNLNLGSSLTELIVDGVQETINSLSRATCRCR